MTITENIGNQTIILNQNEAGVRIVYEQQVAEVPEMKYGHWVLTIPSTPKSYRRICSECNQIAIIIGEKYKYCPNCGTKMKGSEND